MRQLVLYLSLLCTAPVLQGSAAAQPLAVPGFSAWSGPLPAVQNRRYRLKTELAFGGALLPADAYSKQGGGSVSVTYHFSDIIAWEIAHAHAYADWRSGLRRQLEDAFAVAPQRFTVLRYALDSNLVVSPVYAKLNLLNRRLVYLQVFFLAGVGAALRTGGEPDPESDQAGRGLHPALLADVGLGLRLWLSPRWSLRYDLRQYIAVDPQRGDVNAPLYMALTAAVSLGGAK